MNKKEIIIDPPDQLLMSNTRKTYRQLAEAQVTQESASMILTFLILLLPVPPWPEFSVTEHSNCSYSRTAKGQVSRLIALTLWLPSRFSSGY